DATVVRVVLERSRAVGIEVHHRGTSQVIRAGREVILSAGAYNSPKLLMLSGIGRAARPPGPRVSFALRPPLGGGPPDPPRNPPRLLHKRPDPPPRRPGRSPGGVSAEWTGPPQLQHRRGGGLLSDGRIAGAARRRIPLRPRHGPWRVPVPAVCRRVHPLA